jgi:hypothetical protein
MTQIAQIWPRNPKGGAGGLDSNTCCCVMGVALVGKIQYEF